MATLVFHTLGLGTKREQMMFLIHKNNPACSKLTGWERQPRLTHALTRYVIYEHGNEERRLLFMGLRVCASQSVGILGPLADQSCYRDITSYGIILILNPFYTNF